MVPTTVTPTHVTRRTAGERANLSGLPEPRIAQFDSARMAAFTPHDASAERGWPARVLPFNPTLRLTAGLANTYRAVGTKQSLPRHETTADGRLVLTPETPLLAHRYRFMHVLVESDLSQMICAVDTYRHCEPTAEGRRQPLVAIKVLNARHWALGAQEHERVRRLRRGGDGAHCAHVVLPLGHFEVGGHFCIVLELLRELTLLCEAAPPPVRFAGGAAGDAGVGGADARRPGAAGPSYASPRRPLPAAPGLSPPASALEPPPPPLQPQPAAACARLPLALVREAAAALLGALVVLHDQGVLHADLKPQNVMWAPGGGGGGGRPQIKLIDFSNAMSVEETAAYFDTFDVQTLGYRAPEVIYGAKFGVAIDMWSLGVTLAELASGRALVQAASRGGLAVQVAQLLGQPRAAPLRRRQVRVRAVVARQAHARRPQCRRPPPAPHSRAGQRPVSAGGAARRSRRPAAAVRPRRAPLARAGARPPLPRPSIPLRRSRRPRAAEADARRAAAAASKGRGEGGGRRRTRSRPAARRWPPARPPLAAAANAATQRRRRASRRATTTAPRHRRRRRRLSERSRARGRRPARSGRRARRRSRVMPADLQRLEAKD